MSDTRQSAEDLAILEQLNLDYNQSDQAGDAKRFIVQTPGVTRNRDEYLEYIATPRPFRDLALLEAKIRILGDVALIHGRASCTLVANGEEHEALYTDVYQEA